ncbi:MAG: hypothetical protein JWQ36_2943 [Enterovirga sp.]|nr:hypothetical protein [Enterovirga sp.]
MRHPASCSRDGHVTEAIHQTGSAETAGGDRTASVG